MRDVDGVPVSYRARAARRRELTQRRMAERRRIVREILFAKYPQQTLYAQTYFQRPALGMLARPRPKQWRDAWSKR